MTTQVEGIERSFFAQLVSDVLSVNEALRIEDTQPNRRNAVRTSFAAIEGALWVCREHVREGVKLVGELSPLADLALRERSYTVTEQGVLVEQVKFVTLPATLRLLVKQAQTIQPNLAVDFGQSGWVHLRTAIVVRNRATHPKSAEDLTISNDDLHTVNAGLMWLLAITEEIMSAVNTAISTFNVETRHFVELLKQGNPIALKLYEQELTRIEATAESA